MIGRAHAPDRRQSIPRPPRPAPRTGIQQATALAVWAIMMLTAPAVGAHHTLGINQTGKATASPQIPVAQEMDVGEFLVSVAWLPGEPQPGQPTRIVVYAKNTRTGKPFLGPMQISTAAEGWFGLKSPFHTQTKRPVDDRYIEEVTFPDPGAYRIGLEFTQDGQHYRPEFALRVGSTPAWWKYAAAAALALGLAWTLRRARQNRRRLRPV
ncbi:MAG: hypothetical protein V3S29_02520 [bacterium]